MPEGIIYSKVRGVTFEGRQSLIKEHVRPGMRLEAVREPQNPHGSTAIGLWAGKNQVGHISSDLAERLAPQMDAGKPIVVMVTELTGGGPGESIGVNIVIDTAVEAAQTARPSAGRNVALSGKILAGVMAGLLLVCVGGMMIGKSDIAAGAVLIAIIVGVAAAVMFFRRK